ncbi:MAG: NUDIX hydrolase [Lachnospiraceae bacterium]|nr:NUDIX hydrolase [Lachnospiraceae bacterium]
MKTERLERKEVIKGSILTYYKDTVRIPNGHICEWDFIGHQGAAAVLPVDSKGRLILVRQYRNAFDRFMLEIPAGGLESADEPRKEAALRELKEECGLVAEDAEFLLRYYPTVAYSGEKIEIFLARDLKQTERSLDCDEYINVEAWELEDLLKMIYAGELNDGKTVAAILAYACKKERF